LVAGGLVGAAVAYFDKDNRLETLGALPSITLAVAAGLFWRDWLVALSYRRDALALAVGSGEGSGHREGGVDDAPLRLDLALSAALARPRPWPCWPWTRSAADGRLLVAAWRWHVGHAGLNLCDVAARGRADPPGVPRGRGRRLHRVRERALHLGGGAMFGVAPQISAWAIWMAMFGLYIAAAVWVSARRGLS
jgi:hypothetical protein